MKNTCQHTALVGYHSYSNCDQCGIFITSHTNTAPSGGPITMMVKEKSLNFQPEMSPFELYAHMLQDEKVT